MECPFIKDSWVTWSEKAPETWRFIWTPGPMRVVSAYWNDGTPSEHQKALAKQFGVDEPLRMAGWIVTVVYDVDSTSYYNPALSVFFGARLIRTEIHEAWLAPLVNEVKRLKSSNWNFDEFGVTC